MVMEPICFARARTSLVASASLFVRWPRWLVLLLLRGLRARRLECAVANPGILQLPRYPDRKKSLGGARLLGFIHCAGFERHRYRICLVRAGIVKLAVPHNDNGN